MLLGITIVHRNDSSESIEGDFTQYINDSVEFIDRNVCEIAESNEVPLIIPPNIGNGNSYYISPNGNDSNPGTIDEPWKTFSYALKSNQNNGNSPLGPGDTLYVREGEYTQGVLIFNDESQQGENGNYLTITNYPGETPILRNTGFRFRDRDYIRILGLRFEDLPTYGIIFQSRSRPVEGFQVLNNHFENDGSMHGEKNVGMTFISVSTRGESGNPPDVFLETKDVLIAGNTIIDNNDNAVNGSGEAIQPSGNSDYVRIINNKIYGVDNIGIGFAGRTWKNISCENGQCQPDNGLVKGNIIYDFGSPGETSSSIYLDGVGSNFIIEDNISYDGLSGPSISNEGITYPLETDQIIFRNNIMYGLSIYSHKLGSGNNDCESSDLGGPVNDVVSVHNTFILDGETNINVRIACITNVALRNNILTRYNSNENRQYQNQASNTNTTSWDSNYNIFYSASGENQFVWKGNNLGSFEEYQSTTGFDSSSSQDNPLFKDRLDSDFSLMINSPALDAGGPLTFTVNSGTGSSVRVDNANYFTDGFGVQDGDMVSIDGLTARVIGVNYETETLTLDRTISWSQGAEVTYPYSGNAPDIGACEYKTVSSPTPTPTLTATPSATPTPTVTPTSEPSITPGPTSTPTVTPTNTATPSPSATSTPSSSGSASSGSSSSGSGSSGGSGSETIPLSAGIVPFTDVANTTFETYIDSLYERGIINGYNDKTFRPDTYVSRGEMSKFIVNAFEIALDTSGENFKDVDQNNIFWVYIQTMKNNAITSGYPNGTYRPNQSVTRGEATKFVVLALQTKGVSVLLDTNSIFLDTENHTFQPYISFLAQYRPGDEYIIQGYGNGDFGPDDPTTRGAMAKIIHSSSAKFAPGNVLGILDANGPSTYTQKSLGTTFVPQLFVLAVVIGTGILSVGYNSYKSHYI